MENKKYADKENWNKVIKKAKKASPVMEEYKDIVDTWLQEDVLIPRKQRHTAKRIHERLVNEYNFTGAYRTVCSYIEKARAKMKIEKQERYEKLEHPQSEAQVDFYTATLSDYVNWFNNHRIHSSLGYLTPYQYKINTLKKVV